METLTTGTGSCAVRPIRPPTPPPGRLALSLFWSCRPIESFSRGTVLWRDGVKGVDTVLLFRPRRGMVGALESVEGIRGHGTTGTEIWLQYYRTWYPRVLLPSSVISTVPVQPTAPTPATTPILPFESLGQVPYVAPDPDPTGPSISYWPELGRGPVCPTTPRLSVCLPV